MKHESAYGKLHLISHVDSSVCGIDDVLMVGGKYAGSVEGADHGEQHSEQPVPLESPYVPL